MLVLKFLLIFGLSFFGFNLWDSFKKWKISKNYNFFAKGNVDNIKIINQKLYFIIKWGLPPDVNVLSSNGEKSTDFQFYSHFVENTRKFETEQEQADFLGNFIIKYIDKPFNLQLKVVDNEVKDVKPFVGNNVNVVVNGLICIVLIIGLYIIY